MSENSKVVVKVDGQVDSEYDITNPDDLASFTQKAAKGRWYEKNEESISKKLKRLDEVEGKAKIADNWETYLASVKSGQVPIDDLYDKFDQMGIKLNKKDKEELDEDFLDNPKVSLLEDKIKSLETKMRQNNDNAVATQIERTFKSLEKKYDGKDGLPEFDSADIADFVKKKNLYMDSVEDTYENAYFLMNRDAIIEAERSRSNDDRKRLQRRRDGVSEEEPGRLGKFQFTEPVNTKQSWNKITKDILDDMAKQGKSVFIQE